MEGRHEALTCVLVPPDPPGSSLTLGMTWVAGDDCRVEDGPIISASATSSAALDKTMHGITQGLRYLITMR